MNCSNDQSDVAWETLTVLSSFPEAILLKSRLESSGIACRIPEEHMATIYSAMSSSEFRLLVQHYQMADALELLSLPDELSVSQEGLNESHRDYLGDRSEIVSTPVRFNSFKDFWPYYLSEHSKRSTRWIHFFGTSLALTAGTLCFTVHSARLLPLALIGGYGPAWFAHFFIEHNRPVTFKYPAWSLFADFKMWFLMLTRQELI